MKLTKSVLLLLFMSMLHVEGCVVDNQEQDKQIFSQFVGNWKLVSSYYRSDSSEINSAKIVLQDDSLFYSTTSIFWRNDSLKHQPINGKWSVSQLGILIPSSHGDISLSLSLKVDTVTEYWDLEGGTQDSMMYWSTVLQGRLYGWKLDH